MTHPSGEFPDREPPQVADHPAAERYEAQVGGELAGFVEYVRAPEVIEFYHTEVESEFEGQGVGSALARTALDESRDQGMRVRPTCPFIAGWIARHPQYHDLVV